MAMRPKLAFWLASALLFTSALLAAACGTGDATHTPEASAVLVRTPVPAQTTCSETDPNCKPPSAPLAPTPLPLDPTVLSILLRDSVVHTLVDGGELWKDYWLNMSETTDGPHGDHGNEVDILFARPISFSGVVPRFSDPCSGHSGADERVAPGDPCVQEPRAYGTSYVEFHGIRFIQVVVDLGRDAVVNLFDTDSSDRVVDQMIAYLSAQRPATPTRSPP